MINSVFVTHIYNLYYPVQRNSRADRVAQSRLGGRVQECCNAKCPGGESSRAVCIVSHKNLPFYFVSHKTRCNAKCSAGESTRRFFALSHKDLNFLNFIPQNHHVVLFKRTPPLYISNRKQSVRGFYLRGTFF